MATEELAKKTLAVNLNPRARVVIEQIREDTGVPNTEAMTRILEWFASLDLKFRLAVLNKDIHTRTELARLALREMAGLSDDGARGAVGAAPVTLNEAAQIARKMINRIEQIGTDYKVQLERPRHKAGKS